MDSIKELTLEDLVSKAVDIGNSIEDMEAGLRVIKDELRDRLIGMKVQGTVVGDYYINRRKRVSFPDVPMSQAVELGATVTKVDERKLKALYDKGINLPAKTTEFVTITAKKE